MPAQKNEKKTTDLTLKARKINIDFIIMLVAPAVMAWYYYGEAAVRLIVVSIISALFFEAVGSLFLKNTENLRDFNAVFIGAAIALMLPATAPLYLAPIGCAFAILAVKLPLGGTLHAPVIPSAAGFAFLTVCFPKQVFAYPDVALIEAGKDFISGTSITSLLKNGAAPYLGVIDTFDIISGNVAGPMGTGSAIVIVGCALFLLFRHPKSLLNTLGYLAGCSAVILLFPRVGSVSLLSLLLLELCSGTLLFSGVYLVTDSSTSPEKWQSRIYYGVFTGIIVMIMRYFGFYEEMTCFALILANASWPVVNSIYRKLFSVLPAKAQSFITRQNAKTAGGEADG